MNIGELNRKILIQERAVTTNENSFEILVWNTILSPFTKIENTNGSKYFNANSEDMKKNTKFTIRYNSILKTKDETKLRVVYGSRNYTVLYINDPDEKHEFFEIVGEFIGG